MTDTQTPRTDAECREELAQQEQRPSLAPNFIDPTIRRSWTTERGDNSIPVHSCVVDGVLCRWWGDDVPPGVEKINAALSPLPAPSGERDAVLEEELTASLRSSWLFQNHDEPLNEYGLRIIRVILMRLHALKYAAPQVLPGSAGNAAADMASAGPAESASSSRCVAVPREHITRMSDSSFYDEVCTVCGATDASGDDRLNKPCPGERPQP